MLLGIGHRGGEVEPIAIERQRSEAHAAGEACGSDQQADPRCRETGSAPDCVRHRVVTLGM
jgi:hypothetical protein